MIATKAVALSRAIILTKFPLRALLFAGRRYQRCSLASIIAKQAGQNSHRSVVGGGENSENPGVLQFSLSSMACLIDS